MDTKKHIIIFASDAESATILYAYLSKVVTVDAVVLEEPVGRMKVFTRRLKRLGMFTTIGQALFVVFVAPMLRLAARGRIQELTTALSGEGAQLPSSAVHRVPSINDPEVHALVAEHNPAYIVVYGTRLLSKKTLAALPMPIINMHLGYTPQYRGGNGGYWALAQKDLEHCGVTVHLIDAGIDTGDVLAQAKIHPTVRDSFVTYPLLQIEAGLPLLQELVQQEQLAPIDTGDAVSGMWYHPTVWEYVWHRLHGVR